MFSPVRSNSQPYFGVPRQTFEYVFPAHAGELEELIGNRDSYVCRFRVYQSYHLHKIDSLQNHCQPLTLIAVVILRYLKREKSD